MEAALPEKAPAGISDRAPLRSFVPVAVFLVALVGYLALRYAAAYDEDAFARMQCGQGVDLACHSFTGYMVAKFCSAALFYSLLAAPGIFLARSGRRIAFVLPLLLPFAPGPWSTTVGRPIETLFTQPSYFPWNMVHHPASWIGRPIWITHPLLGVTIDFALILAPAAIVAARKPREPWRITSGEVGAVLLALLVVPLVGWVTSIAHHDLRDLVYPWPFIGLMVATFGALLERHRPYWPYVHILIPALLWAALAPIAILFGQGDSPWLHIISVEGVSSVLLPLAAIGFAGSELAGLVPRLLHKEAGLDATASAS